MLYPRRLRGEQNKTSSDNRTSKPLKTKALDSSRLARSRSAQFQATADRPKKVSRINMLSNSFSVAPMMDWTDRHCRFLHRQLTRCTLLYTEMVVADAVIHGVRERLIGFDPAEHPVALQLGGSDPAKLADAVRIGEQFGFDEINLNVGCPSDRVQSGTFGACLMRTPDLVGECVVAMKQAVAVPVTVKCRIGVDEQDPEVALDALAEAV